MLAPRLRIFAGPNGSGKSTIKELIPSDWLGIYINADEIEKTVREKGYLELNAFKVEATTVELHDYLSRSELFRKAGAFEQISELQVVSGQILFGIVTINSYIAAVLADFIRHKLLKTQTSFTFETVMSSEDKVAFMQKAQKAGFRTYLYFVATEDVEINVSRVKHRVETGGHDVPHDKIVSRYARSLGLLSDAVTYANRAYIFDNSGHARVWIAEVTNGETLEIKTDQMPAWFKTALWDKFDASD
jgi:predicted ABC-type ATPase